MGRMVDDGYVTREGHPKHFYSEHVIFYFTHSGSLIFMVRLQALLARFVPLRTFLTVRYSLPVIIMVSVSWWIFPRLFAYMRSQKAFNFRIPRACLQT